MPESPLTVLVLNGPNLNLLGRRETEWYGTTDLPTIVADLRAEGPALGVTIEHVQHNGEGELVEAIQTTKADGAVINAAAYTHTSIALRDALAATGLPFVEVHLSNVYRREPFRHRSLLADLAVGVVTGFGPGSYRLGLQGLIWHLRGQSSAD